MEKVETHTEADIKEKPTYSAPQMEKHDPVKIIHGSGGGYSILYYYYY